MKYYIVTADLQGGEFGMERAYTAKDWAKQAYTWACSDGDEDAEHWKIENFKNEQELIDSIGDVWDLAFAEISAEQKEVYENLLKELDIAGTNFYSAELKHNVEDQKFYKKQAFELRQKLDNFYEGVQKC